MENDTIVVDTYFPQTYYSGGLLSNSSFLTYKIPVSDIIRNEVENPNPISRAVTMPAIANAIVSYEEGIYYIPSMSDFVFTIQPTGTNTGRVPVVTTNRVNVPDSEGVKIEDNGDGSYTVSILCVQQSVTISVDFATGNEVVDKGNKVWADKDMLYIQTATNRIVNIYNAAGVLLKSINIPAGETTGISLPVGLYVVKPDNDKVYKIILR